jgi:chemosensory pili system protein ChpA (sensor histidine kinase/response regulator)
MSRKTSCGLARPSVGPDAAADRARATPPPHLVVLFVDDAEDTREVAALVLGQEGYRVALAADGLEAVAQAGAILPDAIVMDFEMPVMDGGKAMRCLASNEQTVRIPVVMISGAVDRVPADVRLGCAGLLAKPFSADDLAQLLHLVIAARGVSHSSNKA